MQIGIMKYVDKFCDIVIYKKNASSLSDDQNIM